MCLFSLARQPNGLATLNSPKCNVASLSNFDEILNFEPTLRNIALTGIKYSSEIIYRHTYHLTMSMPTNINAYVPILPPIGLKSKASLETSHDGRRSGGIGSAVVLTPISPGMHDCR